MASVAAGNLALSTGAAENTVPPLAEKAAHNIASSCEWKLADSCLKGCMKHMGLLGRHSMPGLDRIEMSREHSAVDNEARMLGSGRGLEGHFLEVDCMAALDKVQLTTRV